MTLHRRAQLGLSAAIALLLLAGGYSVLRLVRWHHLGWTGMTIAPSSRRGVSRQQPGAPAIKTVYAPHSVVLAFPGSPAWHSGLRVADRVVAINGIPHENRQAMAALDARVKAGDVLTYTMKHPRDKQTYQVQMRVASPLRSPVVLAQVVVLSGVGLTFFVIGVLVYFHRPDDRRAFVFFIFTLVASTSMIGNMSTAFESGRGIQEAEQFAVGGVIVALVAAAFGPLTLHLALIFPEDRPVVRKTPEVIRWVYFAPLFFVAVVGASAGVLLLRKSGSTGSFVAVAITAAVVAALTLGPILRRRTTDGFRRAVVRSPLLSLLSLLAIIVALAAVFFLVHLRAISIVLIICLAVASAVMLGSYPILAVVSLYRSYRDAGVEQKRQVAWPLWGTIIALGTRVLISGGSAIFGGIAGAMAATNHGVGLFELVPYAQILDLISRIVYILIPISFAAAILKYRLMNIDRLIRKTVLYAILSGLVIALYLGIVGGIGTMLIRMAGVRSQTMIVASTLVIALIVVPLRNRLQSLVDRNLFRQKIDYPQALRAIAADTMNATATPAFLAGVSEKVQHALQNRAVVIFLRRADDYVAAAKVGVADSLVGTLRTGGAIADSLDRPFDPRRRAMPPDAAYALQRIEAALVVPVRAYGFLAVAEKLSDRTYDVEDIEFLASAADQVAIGLERIRLQREETDYTQAREIQETLLPRTTPRVAGLEVSGMWQPARSVGGDYYDYLELTPTRLGVCIGDVAGKGMPAALLMSGLQAAVRASAGDDPADVCERVRRVAVSSLTGGKFITFFYCVADTEAKTLRWCNAGHNVPLLIRASGEVLHLSDGGPVFSRVFRESYRSGETSLERGDRIILYTDGLTEAHGAAAGEMFGEERLAQLVLAHRTRTARELQSAIVDTVTSFGGSEAEDDLTLVVVAVT